MKDVSQRPQPVPTFRSAFSLAAALLLAHLPARAQQSVDTQAAESAAQLAPGQSRWGVGVGLAAERKPYRDFDDQAQPIPLLMYSNRYVTILGPSVDLHLPSAGPVALRLRARYSLDGYEAEDSPWLAGMEERKRSVWLGGAAIWRTSVANLSAEFLKDGSDHSKGSKLRLQIDRRFAAGAWAFSPRIAAQRLDDDYVDYYYGVRSNEARTGRARYEGVATTNTELGVRLDYAIGARQSVFLDLSATRLGNGIKASPLVERSSSRALLAGYVYRY